MKNKTKGTILFICGIICAVGNALFIVLNLAFKYDFDGANNILSDIIFLAIGIYFCWLGIRVRNKDK